MSVREVFRVLYAPHKALREIIQNPDYKGPLIIMLLFVLSFSGFYYVLSARVYYDQTEPKLTELDKWTEDAGLWRSNLGANVTINATDYIKGNYYGNRSIQFTLENSTKIDMELEIPESLNCLEPYSYTNLTFRIKIVEPASKPAYMDVYLFSENAPDKYFKYSLPANNLTIGVWNNKTILLKDFEEVQGADWKNITSLKFELAWPSNQNNIMVLIDGVFFHGVYESLLDMSGNAVIVNSAISGFMQFTIQWVMLGVILYLFLKIFRVQPIWKTILTISGFVLITFFIQHLILMGIVLTYPEMYLSLETLGGVPGEGWTADARNFTSILIIKYDILDRIIYYIWIVALCSIAVHLLFEFPWAKSISVSLLSSLISMLAFRFLIYGGVWL
ncbi:MAG: hypothetical protein QXK33_04830 [Candidatus Bathyarchaeia archaeon]